MSNVNKKHLIIVILWLNIFQTVDKQQKMYDNIIRQYCCYLKRPYICIFSSYFTKSSQYIKYYLRLLLCLTTNVSACKNI